jgi:hypothetical protein
MSHQKATTNIPRLIKGGKKFDLRQWVLLIGPKSSDPSKPLLRDVAAKAYVFEPCYARRCQAAFSMTAENLKV